ncbi:MAG: extracellular solute-binding protein, partial [Microbacterium sp.]|nr:extracellular solute-binding protein [Microbacterium sp.]
PTHRRTSGIDRYGPPEFRPLARSTAAHSTATVNDTSSCRFSLNSGLSSMIGTPIIAGPTHVQRDRVTDIGRQGFVASHDGYVRLYGIYHERRMVLSHNGSVIQGADRFYRGDAKPLKANGRDQIAIRFHLHPAVDVSFDENGLKVPTTWSEFENVVSTLKGKGVTPLGIGGKDSWPAGLGMIAAVQGLYPSADDKNALSKDLWAGKVDLADGKQLEVLQRVKSLYDAAQKNFSGVGYDAIPSEFAKGQVAMTVDGTWNQPTIDAAVNGAFDYGYFPLPASDNAADNKWLGGKVELRMVAASNGPNKAAALAYLAFFSEPAQYAKFVATAGFAPAEPNIPSSDFLKSIEPYTSTFSPAWDTIWRPNPDAGQAALFPFNYPGITPLGTKSVDAAAKDSQTAWQAGL